LEGKWADALAAGKDVKVEWRFEYSGSSLRPDKLDVVYTIDGVRAVQPFANAPGGK
jgi:hypothetical protein